jgi:cell cycle sensor histidine kinase DivJ
VGLFAPFRDHFGAWARSASARDALTGARARVLAAALLRVGLIGLSVFAVYLLMRHGTSVLELVILACLLLTVVARAWQLSRSTSVEGARASFGEEDRYRLLARNMSDVITRHRRNGAVLLASPSVEALVGVPARELLGQGLLERVHVADRPAYLTALSDAAAQGDDRSVEFRLRRDRNAPGGDAGPGEFIWIEMRCRALVPTRDNEVVAVLRDITERKRQEQLVEEARLEAERASVAKSHFLATMSHELRTPLNAIIGFSEMLTKDDVLLIDAGRRREYAHLINESGLHLLAVVNSILDMSKIETGNFQIRPESFAPEQVIADSCEMLALKAHEAGVELTMRVPGELPLIVADKRAVSQIMLNLLANAIKFSDRGGRITISAQALGDTIAVSVEDNGEGIEAEALSRVGDPFFQARSSYDRRHDGSGLGLSIVKGLLALHGGELEINSRLGEGTRVTFCLPLDCERGRERERPVVERLVPRHAAEVSNDRVKKSA